MAKKSAKAVEAPILENSVDAFKQAFTDHIHHTLARNNVTVTDHEKFLAVAYAVRDRLIDRWIKTQETYYEKDVKVVYYLSMEFLMGRFFGNALINLEMFDEVKEVIITKIYFIVDKLNELGYEDLWNPALEDNVAIVGNHRVINGITLKTMGESFNTYDLNVIQQAGDKLLELAPNIRIISDSNTQDYVVSGEVAAAFLYTSQVSAALTANAPSTPLYAIFNPLCIRY